jgi:glycosyltransferase domain-containing protein
MNNFTLIIPTHNRHQYLKRSMEYFKDLEAEVIYCDSSIEKYIGDLKNNIKYLHFPEKSFAEKINLVLSNIKTKYVALCADDDFIIIESLYKGFEFLKKNKEFNTVVGKYIAFNEKFNGEYYKRYTSIPDDVCSNASNNAEYFFKNYYQILWAMYDKEILIKAFIIINEASFKNDNFIEMVIGSCACYKGGIKILDEIWGVRELSAQDHWGMRHIPLNDIVNINQDNDCKMFKKLVNEKTFEGYSDLVLNSYLKGRVLKNNTLKKMIPKSIKLLIKKVINLLFSKKKHSLILSSNEEKNMSRLSLILKSNCIE